MSNADKSSVGYRIRHQREHISMTQREMCSQLFMNGLVVDPSALSRIESGERSLRVNELASFSMALKVPVSYFVAGMGWESGGPSSFDIGYARGLADAVQAIQNITQ